jgi:hypothetical protein
LEDVVNRAKRLADKLLEEQEKVEPVKPKESARELVELICSGNYLLIGGQALKAYLEPRFTKDLDFLVDKDLFDRVIDWLKKHKVNFEKFSSAALRVEPYSVDVVNAGFKPILKAVLTELQGDAYEDYRIPSKEGMILLKYISMIDPARRLPRKRQDAVDFANMVSSGFCDKAGLEKLLSQFLPEEVSHFLELVKRAEDGELLII